jgi:flagellar biosynthesis protein FliP
VNRARTRVPAAVAAVLLGLLLLLGAGAASASASPLEPEPVVPEQVAPGETLETPAPQPEAPQTQAPGPTGPVGPDAGGDAGLTIEFEDPDQGPSQPVLVLIGLTLLSLVPAILLTCTSFTKVLVVLGLTRNALGLQQTPPNQVLAGLALFLSLFIMAPTLSQMNDEGVQPYLNAEKSQTQAWNDGIAPLRAFMLDHTGDDELRLLTAVADRDLPDNRAEVSMATLVPSYVLSELKQAFIIGFVIFIPFLVIDIVISAALMSLGMMMMPPVMVSLPFKLLLFVLVDGWGLIIESLVSSYG